MWRARVALRQGPFLAGLGVGVVASSICRVLVPYRIKARITGLFSALALVIIVVSTPILRSKDDANAQAV